MNIMIKWPNVTPVKHLCIGFVSSFCGSKYLQKFWLIRLNNMNWKMSGRLRIGHIFQKSNNRCRLYMYISRKTNPSTTKALKGGGFSKTIAKVNRYIELCNPFPRTEILYVRIINSFPRIRQLFLLDCNSFPWF